MKRVIDKYKILVLLFRGIFWLLTSLVIYMILLKLTGHSPTTGDIALGLASSIWVIFFTFAVSFARDLGEIKSDIKNLTKINYALGEDLKKHINDSK